MNEQALLASPAHQNQSMKAAMNAVRMSMRPPHHKLGETALHHDGATAPAPSLSSSSSAMRERRVAQDSAVAAELGAGSWREWDGVLIVDARGGVAFCSSAAAELFGSPRAELVGQPVAALIPDLPFARETPEFNLAYVIFSSDDGQWRRRTLALRDGRQMSVEVSINTAGGRDGEFGDVDRRCIIVIIKDAQQLAQQLAQRVSRAYVPLNRQFIGCTRGAIQAATPGLAGGGFQ